ncbi:adenine-specific methyltransferase EcoRI family protein [uncultured Draconibacterium sp.]|uniref:adenine-specific methyltransferase EcoRI family protein n=1 Tax=uncultured Draconibacterium sp. TaxID=1573823 RepID=UPI0025DE3AAD|nr:adenine-specific methyltransferase EcoRI family protein [uncultured Draconibacterium sp.]
MANKNLTAAKRAKNDEFYTQYHDIEKEINAYIEYNPDVFRGKTILLPCDDPEWSNFTKFFAQNFERFGLKKLISTSYAANSKKYKSGYQPTLFEVNDPQYDEYKTKQNGKIFTLDHDKSGDGRIDVDDLEWHYLDGDGDFKSDEIKKLRNEADVIITNPPFSLFRDFLAWVLEDPKQFIIISNMNAITYKEVFPLIKENRIWLGAGKNDGRNVWYQVPDNYNNFHKEEDGKKFAFVAGTIWLANIDHGRRHQPLQLMPERDVIKYGTKEPFRKYENYDAIEVPQVKYIPSDYDGLMGVPISFLSKYCPEQFEIIGSSRTLGIPMSKIAKKGTFVQGGPRFYLSNGDGTYRRMYDRLVIKKRTL